MRHVYILRCSDNSLYVGSTENLDIRIDRHAESRTSRCTARRLPVHLVYSEELSTMARCVARERQLKRWTRAKKEA